MNIIDEYVGDSPFIIIEKVILGYRYTQDDLSKISRTKLAIESKLNGKPINFELSHLSNKFHGE